MASIFLAIPQYKKMPEAEVERIKKANNLEHWKSWLKGFHPMFDISVWNLCHTGNKVCYCLVKGDGNLPRVRSLLLAQWKKEWDRGNKFEYYMIVDEDISWEPEAIDLLIKDDKPIIGGIYTFKTKDKAYIGKVATMLWDGVHGDLSRPFKVRWLNGGFILVKAEVLLTMIEKHPELRFDTNEEEMGFKETWILWLPGIFEDKQRGKTYFLSEDWAFCQRAREDGFEIWADWRVKLTHWNAEYGYRLIVEDPNVRRAEAGLSPFPALPIS